MKRRTTLFFTFVFLLGLSLSIDAIESALPLNDIPEILTEKEIEERLEQLATPALMSFNYQDEELVNVITELATKKGLNLLLPTKTDEKVTGKLNWKLDRKVTIDEGWNLLQTICSIAGYSILSHPTYSEVVKNNAAVSREPVPLYIGIPYEQLPASDERIRYIHYLSNIKSQGEGGAENELNTILKAWLPPVSAGTNFKIDSASNALIIMASANDIRGVMPVVVNLDRPGFQEKMEIIPLRHTEAKMIAELFNSKILPSNEQNRYRLDAKKVTDSTYFSKHLRIISNERRNNLVVLGRPQAIDRVREFIRHYLDVEHDSGRSILHTYQLQYLSAPSFAKVLETIVQQKDSGGFEQATGGQQKVTGPQRYFGDVIIATDTPEGPDNLGEEQTGGFIEGEGKEATTLEAKYYGGNKLIIACRNDDWKRLRDLIEKLDQPSPQVLIEVLIADLTLDDTKALGAALRNPQKIPMPGETAFQSAQLSPGVMPDSFDPQLAQTIGLIEGADCAVQASSDLLRTFGTDSESGNRIDAGTDSIASGLPPGTTALSFNDNDGKTFGIAQILKVLDHRKVLSHPHILSTSGQKARLEITDSRRLRDTASGSSGNTINAQTKNIEASLKVEITPRISVSEIQETSVNLQVLIDIDQFLSPTNNTRFTRNVTTNVTMNSGDIVALGGLIRSNESDSLGQTPVLGSLPLIGWMFKNRSKVKERSNLTVFIAPTVILPRLREGMGEYTRDYLGIAREWAQAGGMFDTLKDPITRWFFQEESTTEKFTNRFLKNDIRFQDVPMPHTQVKHGHYVKNEKIEKDDPSKQTVILAQEKLDQSEQLKDLLKDLDNPFKQLSQHTQVAENSLQEEKALSPARSRRGKKK